MYMGVDSRGVFPNPDDIAIQGRHNTDADKHGTTEY